MRGLHGTPPPVITYPRHANGKRAEHGRDDASAVEARIGVVEKTGFAGPLIRPTGTFSPRGEEGIETFRHIP
ncbi:hypothetical protein E0I74_04780 [Rhizobium laguerreae]|nr:hypothetical protein E0I74_04780 [Rhizobium laguerreae]